MKVHSPLSIVSELGQVEFNTRILVTYFAKIMKKKSKSRIQALNATE